ncbi:hypothetical protein J2X01_002938 [Arthrobacter ginsengisoli]|uniref:Lipoprotein n=1 Tax=Arthrobacter ginsengisoli TaxID=1356565 RepID=A0ABU1UEL4_9MICC|nr:hypothetical protein [Arthrobacter ginsengisoli]MDR7083643.1 hypothetical protein [Arthrobacter ginsengisoli]
MGRAASFATSISALSAAVILAGCGSPAAAPATSSPTVTPATTSASPATATPAPTVTVPAGWKTFTTSDGSLAFDYPETWTIKDPAGEPAEGGVFVELVSDYGKTMATLRTNMVTGAECTEKFPFMTYDAEPVPALTQGGVAPRFVYESRTNPASSDPSTSLSLAYGITSAPEPAGETACPIFHFFTWPPSGAMFGGVYDPFDTTPGGPMHVDTPEVYMDTTEYKDVKQAITSLRPVGKQ